jgi:RNA polymerase sigma factor (sigma-70 family)
MASSRDRAALFGRAAAGDPGAFQDLMARHEKAVKRVLGQRLADPEDVQDGLCEVFARAWRGMGQVRSPLRLSGWLRTIARRVAAEALAERQREQDLLSRVASTAQPDPGTEHRDELAAVRQALQRLPADSRRVLLLSIDGRTHGEIAEALGATAGAARTRLHRARRALRAEVDRIMGQPKAEPTTTTMSGLGNLLHALGAVGGSIDDIDEAEAAKWQRCIEKYLAGGGADASDELFIHFSVRNGRWSMRLVGMPPGLRRIPSFDGAPGINLRSAAADACALLADPRVLRVLSALQRGSLTPAATRRQGKVTSGEWDEVYGKLVKWSAVTQTDGRLTLTEIGDGLLREALVFGLKCASLRDVGRRFGVVPRPSGRR